MIGSKEEEEVGGQMSDNSIRRLTPLTNYLDLYRAQKGIYWLSDRLNKETSQDLYQTSNQLLKVRQFQ